MSFLDILKKFNSSLIAENKKLEHEYKCLVNESYEEIEETEDISENDEDTLMSEDEFFDCGNDEDNFFNENEEEIDESLMGGLAGAITGGVAGAVGGEMLKGKINDIEGVQNAVKTADNAEIINKATTNGATDNFKAATNAAKDMGLNVPETVNANNIKDLAAQASDKVGIGTKATAMLGKDPGLFGAGIGAAAGGAIGNAVTNDDTNESELFEAEVIDEIEDENGCKIIPDEEMYMECDQIDEAKEPYSAKEQLKRHASSEKGMSKIAGAAAGGAIGTVVGGMIGHPLAGGIAGAGIGYNVSGNDEKTNEDESTDKSDKNNKADDDTMMSAAEFFREAEDDNICDSEEEYQETVSDDKQTDDTAADEYNEEVETDDFEEDDFESTDDETSSEETSAPLVNESLRSFKKRIASSRK